MLDLRVHLGILCPKLPGPLSEVFPPPTQSMQPTSMVLGSQRRTILEEFALS